jgi:hypothetical protein
VNTEEIEVSLKSEFESYLQKFSDRAKENTEQLKAKFSEEQERHRAEIEKLFSSFSQAEGETKLNPAFADAVMEHLRLARDEGARITANAFAEAEQFEKERAESEPVVAAKNSSKEIRDAIKDISEKGSQAEILKTLINHAGHFAARGAFFVVKNERFGGWRAFGEKSEGNDEAVKQISFPVSAPSLLNEAVRFNAPSSGKFGAYEEDTDFLGKLGYGEPKQMFAIPLVVRGRGVAVLYADSGEANAPVDIEALEALVNVASLRVELLASLRSSQEAESVPVARETETAAPVTAPVSAPVDMSGPLTYPAAAYSYENAQVEIENDDARGFETESAPSIADAGSVSAPDSSYEFEAASSFTQPADDFAATAEVGEAAEVTWETESKNEDVYEFSPEPASAPEYTTEYAGESNGSSYEVESKPAFGAFTAPSFDSFKPAEAEAAPSFKEEQAYASFEPQVEAATVAPVFSAEPAVVETVAAPVSAPAKSRLSDRNVDLPIEVGDDERRLHNDARRFARLLVSEIKLYNEQKVKEGRESRDIYERLKEAIDRSREMYDKRVQSAVSSRFDYFHYELVNSLAEGDESGLGASYPGATV